MALYFNRVFRIVVKNSGYSVINHCAFNSEEVGHILMPNSIHSLSTAIPSISYSTGWVHI